MTKCGKCGFDNPDSGRFCSSCGALVVADSTATRTVALNAPSRQHTARTTTNFPSASRFAPGTILAERYRIVALLGKGGMGEVYRADDLTLGQQVALKFLPESLASNPGAVTRFRNEVRIARQVSHVNVCRVYDLSETDGHLFLSMEYVNGEDLGSLLRRIGRLPADKALEIARKLCAGLAAAHEKGVLHRDLKPSNVMLDGRGQVLLTDFGIAGLSGEIEGAEVGNGTPAYMAPEQLSGEDVSVRSDIYSLGLVLYEIFTGKPPFESATLAGLMQARRESVPVNPSTLVRDLDPVVERVILRCLQPKPANRPGSVLAVAAALPGGDPLAAALAAGETPSPEMVAAAGEGTGLAPRVAIPLFLAVLAGIALSFALMIRTSALDQMRPEYSPDVLAQKARDMVQRLGYTRRPFDDAYGFFWDYPLIGHIEKTDKPLPRWKEILQQRPSLLRFWYRESEYPLTAGEFHDDILTPGVVFLSDPAPILSGMIELTLDPQGRLIHFEAIPAQVQEPVKAPTQVDWNVLFSAAGLDSTQFQPAEPLWTWLATSDVRTAWTGKWPDSSRPLRVEAAALRGRPVAFSLIGPWTKPGRMPPQESPTQGQGTVIILGTILLVVCFGSTLLARRNLARGDRRGAIRLAVCVFCVQMALWICRVHIVGSIGMFAMFVLALCTSVFYGVVIWTVYVALEPYVRRHWPHTIISWTSILSGNLRDSIVGRDILIGAAVGTTWKLVNVLSELWFPSTGTPSFASTDALLGGRSTLTAALLPVPHAIRETLFFFFLVFLLRVLLRKQWLAGAGFVLIFAGMDVLGSSRPWVDGPGAVLVFSLAALVILRWGLLAIATGILVNGLLYNIPYSTHASAWYFGSTIFMLGIVIALVTWAFTASIAGRRIWKQDLFS